MLFKRLFQVAFLLFLMVSTVMGVSAQDMPGREDVRPFVRVTFGSRTDNYVYYTPDNPDYTRIVTILNTAIPIYSTMTGLPWTTQIVIVFMDNTPGSLFVLGRMFENSTAYVTRREPPNLFPEAESCHIRIYGGWESAPNLGSLVARELFYCLQMSIGAATFEDFRNPQNAWWRMGIAEWAASRVYPSQYPRLIHNFFDPRQSITRARFDAFYFWEFASSARGFGSDQNVIAQMRDMSSFPINFSFGSLELFHNWAQVLLNRQLPIPPTVDLTGSDLTAGRGGSITTFTPQFAVDYKNLVAFDLEPGNIAFVTVKDIASTLYQVSARTSSGVHILVEDEPFQFCPSDDGTMLIISRGRSVTDAPAPFTIEWGQVPNSTPCTEVAEEVDDAVACVVGSWVVTDHPEDLEVAFPVIDISGFIFNFAGNGTFDGTYNVFYSIPDLVQVEINFTFKGSYVLSGVEGSSTTYGVQTFRWAFDPSGNAVLTDQNGVTSDFAQQFIADGDLSLWSPNGTLNCNENGMSWQTTRGGSIAMARLP